MLYKFLKTKVPEEIIRLINDYLKEDEIWYKSKYDKSMDQVEDLFLSIKRMKNPYYEPIKNYIIYENYSHELIEKTSSTRLFNLLIELRNIPSVRDFLDPRRDIINQIGHIRNYRIFFSKKKFYNQQNLLGIKMNYEDELEDYDEKLMYRDSICIPPNNGYVLLQICLINETQSLTIREMIKEVNALYEFYEKMDWIKTLSIHDFD